MTTKRILLVEDNPDDIELTRRAFGRIDHENQIDVATDGADALDYLFGRGRHAERETDPLPDLILLDLRLPRLDGLEVLRAIRAGARTRLLPVIVLTSSAEEIDLVNCYREGVNSYLRKPVDFSRMLDLVKTLHEYWFQFNQPPPMSQRT